MERQEYEIIYYYSSSLIGERHVSKYILVIPAKDRHRIKEDDYKSIATYFLSQKKLCEPEDIITIDKITRVRLS